MQLTRTPVTRKTAMGKTTTRRTSTSRSTAAATPNDPRLSDDPNDRAAWGIGDAAAWSDPLAALGDDLDYGPGK